MSDLLGRLLTAWIAWRVWRTRNSSTFDRMLAQLPEDMRESSLARDYLGVVAAELDAIFPSVATINPGELAPAFGLTRAPGESDEGLRDRLLHTMRRQG